MNTCDNYINDIGVYFNIMNKINELMGALMYNNSNKDFEDYELLFFDLTYEIMRIIPYKKIVNRDTKKILGFRLLEEDGLLLLKAHIPFLATKYNKILNNPNYFHVLNNIIDTRNKFIHEPHNIRAAYSVGGPTSCSVGLYYRQELMEISTITLSPLIYYLNEIFNDIQRLIFPKIDTLNLTNPYLNKIASMKFDSSKYSFDYEYYIKNF